MNCEIVGLILHILNIYYLNIVSSILANIHQNVTACILVLRGSIHFRVHSQMLLSIIAIVVLALVDHILEGLGLMADIGEDIF